MSKVGHEKPLPALPGFEPTPGLKGFLKKLNALLLFCSLVPLVNFYLAYIHSTNATITGLVALPTLIVWLAARLTWALLFPLRSVRLFAIYVVANHRQGVKTMRAWYMIFTPFWLYYIGKAANVMLAGSSLGREAARLALSSETVPIRKQDASPDTESDARAVVAQMIATWEVESGLSGHGKQFTEFWAQTPELANFWDLGVVVVSMLFSWVLVSDFVGCIIAFSPGLHKKMAERRKIDEEKAVMDAVRQIEEYELTEALAASAA